MVDPKRHLYKTNLTGISPNSASTAIPTNIKLLPIPVLPYAPVRQDERQHYLKLLFDQYLKSYKKNESIDNINQSLKNSIILKSVNKEFELAKSCKIKSQYQHEIKKLMFNLKKSGNENGIINNNDDNSNKDNNNNDDDEKFNEILIELENLCIPVQRLKRHNYIMEIPKLSDLNYKLPTLLPCNHCGINFNINDIDKIINCNFHRGKLQTKTYNNLDKGKKIFGTDYTDRFYSCCNEPKGQSQGCEITNHHVYKFNNAIDLHLSKNFQKIEDLRSYLNIKNNSKSQILRKSKIKAVGIDCEMCYTNKGFEMMKLSLIDFKTEKKLLDSIIHPDGNLIIDLNSKISGINEIPENSLTFDEALIKLAQLTDKDTIIIGHGLENDLNVLRLIYPKIIDTAILFSENQIDIRRKDPLKKLAWSYLSENIQGREHDSLEDAIIPCKIVKKHIEKILLRKQRNKM
jgi:hypothetical protein